MQAVNRLIADRGQRPLGSPRSLSGLSLRLRYRPPLPARGIAAAQDHRGRNAASLQRDADRCVFAFERDAPAHCLDDRWPSRRSGILARRCKTSTAVIDRWRRCPDADAAETSMSVTASAAASGSQRLTRSSRCPSRDALCWAVSSDVAGAAAVIGPSPGGGNSGGGDGRQRRHAAAAVSLQPARHIGRW